MKNKFLLLPFGFALWASGVFAQSPNFIYTQTCSGNQTTLVASSSLPDSSIASWQWDLNGDGIYDYPGKIAITNITINDTVAVKLMITPKAGPADSITKNVIIDPLPQVNFMANNLCELKAATYISLSSVATGLISQYKWDFDNNGVDDFTGNDTALYTCGPASTYMTKLTCVSDKGCSASKQQNTIVYPNPAAAFAVSNSCENDTVMFTNTSIITNPFFFLWNFGDGNQTSTSGNANHIYSASGSMNVELIAVTQEGCRDTASSSFTVYSLPVPAFTAPAVCLGAQTSFTDASSGGITSWNWNFGDGNQTVTGGNANHIYSASGTYSTVLTVTSINNCQNTTSADVIVNALPVVSITASELILHPGGSVDLIANGANNYAWSTGANSISITVTQNGIYSVTGTDANNCIATNSITIVNENTDTVSVFGIILTPNEDNINDALMINNVSAYSNCDLKIYNMWNDEVFSFSGYKNDWKGTNASGAPLSAGAYYYIIQCDDKPVLKGNINILR